MANTNKNKTVDDIVEKLGSERQVTVKEILIGEKETVEAWVIYINGQVDRNMIDKDILTPLMLKINSKLDLTEGLPDYICKRYITCSNAKVTNNIDELVNNIKFGFTAIVIRNINNYIMVDTSGGEYRSISDPLNEYSIKGTRESFVENFDTNITMLVRRIKDTNLVVEKLVVGRRSHTRIALIYIKDIVNKEVLNNIRNKIQQLDVDSVISNGILEQYIEKYTYSIFPQVHSTERPDIMKATILEGRVGVIQEGTPNCFTAPAVFIEFFQGAEDYYQRTLVANFTRILRYIAIMIIITLPSIYLALVKFNVELIPLKFIIPITKSRMNIALPPFLEILSNDKAFAAVFLGKTAEAFKLNFKGYPSSSDYIEGMIESSVNYNFFPDQYRLIDIYARVDAVNGVITIKDKTGENTDLQAISNKKVKCKKEKDKYSFTIDVMIKLDIIENDIYNNLQNDPREIKALEEDAKKVVENMCYRFINKMQGEIKVDCLQLGRVAAAKYGRNKGTDWNKVVSEADIKVNVKTRLDRIGRGKY